MSFTEFIKKYLNTNSPLGDFAKDAIADKKFPLLGDKNVYKNYLQRNRACDGCLDSFNKAWNNYTRTNKQLKL